MTTEWKILSLSDKTIIKAAIQEAQIPLSDYSFTNLWMWHASRNYSWKKEDSSLCLKFYEKEKLFYLYPLGIGSQLNVIRTLQRDHDTPFTMRAIPEYALKDLEEFNAFIKEERDRFDYIYNFQDLNTLSGNSYQAKRNFIHQFENNYSYEYLGISESILVPLIALEKEWFSDHPEPSLSMQQEHAACLRALNDFKALNYTGGALFIDNKAIAYSFAEKTTKDMLVVHVEKALKEYKGAYVMMGHELLKHFEPVDYVNKEEDLGLHNLAKIKHSYHPIRLEKKFSLSIP